METKITKDTREIQTNGQEFLETLNQRSRERLDKLKVSQSLQQLETLRNEDWHEDFISQCLQEFENINWTTELCIERINNCKLKKPFGLTKFSEFIEDDDLIVDNELIVLKAKLLLSSKQFVDASTYQTLINYYYKNKQTDINAENLSTIQYEIKIQLQMKEILDEAYKTFISKVYPTGFLSDAVCEKATGEFIESLKSSIENFKL